MSDVAGAVAAGAATPFDDDPLESLLRRGSGATSRPSKLRTFQQHAEALQDHVASGILDSRRASLLGSMADRGKVQEGDGIPFLILDPYHPAKIVWDIYIGGAPPFFLRCQ